MKGFSPGLIQVYTGNGKGKSTAAFGLALRAAGQGYCVNIVQFMKSGDNYGESKIFKKIDNVSMYSYGIKGFLHQRKVTQEDFQMAKKALTFAKEKMLDGETELLILDEINNALRYHLLQVEDVLAFLREKPEWVEVVLTGRGVPEEIIAVADLVSEVKVVKHPMDEGIKSRKGIEF